MSSLEEKIEANTKALELNTQVMQTLILALTEDDGDEEAEPTHYMDGTKI